MARWARLKEEGEAEEREEATWAAASEATKEEEHGG